MEIGFQVHLLKPGEDIRIVERGDRLTSLVGLFRRMAKELSESDRGFYLVRWIERCTKAAYRAGAKIPNKKRHVSPGVVDELPTSSKKRPRIIEKPSLQPAAAQASGPSSASRLAVAAKPATTFTARTLFEVGCRRTTLEEALAIQKRITQRYGTDPEELREREEQQKLQKEERAKAMNCARQQNWRDRKKGLKEVSQEVKTTTTTHLLAHDTASGAKEMEDIAEVSRPGGLAWKEKRTGKKGGVVQKRHERVNWYHPFLWPHIDKIAAQVDWSPTRIANHLSLTQPKLFGRLHKGTVVKWLSRNDRKRWSEATLQNVERHGTLPGSGRAGILSKHPEVVDEIKAKLEGLRKSGVPVGRLLARSVILAIVQEKIPTLLDIFKCSESFVGQFLSSVMGWSLRHGTRAAAHLPDDAHAVCERAFYRLVHLIHFYDIPPGLIINMDQTGVYILKSHNITYDTKGKRQVDINNLDEKRAYTLCVASTPAGDILPFQQVWAGQTKASLPTERASSYKEAIDLGFHFAFAQSPKKTSHFSTLKTMKEWMTKILKPWVEDYIERASLPADQKSILFIDCYPVHIGKEFRTYVFDEFPNIFLVFVPVNCTPIFQPADVGLQCVVKQIIRQKVLDFLVENHASQIQEGLTPEQVKVTTSLPTLRDASVSPIVDVFKFLQGWKGREIVQNAWKRCIVGNYNLGEECLQSKHTKAAYREYLKKDDTLRKEIEGKLGENFLDKDNLEEMQAEPESQVDDFDDPEEIPLDTIIERDTGVHGPFNIASSRFCLQREALGSDLQPIADSENIWAYHEDGTLVADSLAAEDS
ncbi:hypothetical protein H1R20_g2448, partial [Candolleomyces eurysporus]